MPISNPYIAQFAGVPALVAPHLQERITALLRSMPSDDTFAAAEATTGGDFWAERTALRPYTVDANGVLRVPVSGVLLNKFPFAFGSAATGYEYISQAIDRGLADSQVKGIALVIDSPGGMVAGNFDLADKIYAARDVKPIEAFLSEEAYSAAYSLASAASKITVARTGGAGSIGVVTSHVDYSKAMEAEGVKVTFIHAGRHKVDGNPYEPLSEDTQNRIQAEINGLYDIFVATVARNRGMDEKAVRATEALTYTASQSLSIGLADAIGSLDDGLAAFAAVLNTKPGEKKKMPKTLSEDTGAVDQAMLDAARNEAQAKGHAEGVTAERARIVGIMKLDEAANRRDAAFSIATTTELSVDQAKTLLATLPQSKQEPEAVSSGSGFNAAMDATGNPTLSNQPAQAAAGVSVSAEIIRDYRAAGGLA